MLSSFLITLHLLFSFFDLLAVLTVSAWIIWRFSMQDSLQSSQQKHRLQAHTRTCRDRPFLGALLNFALLWSRSLIRNAVTPGAGFWRLAVLPGWHTVPTYVALPTTMLHSNLISGMQWGLYTACLFSTDDWASPTRNVWYQCYNSCSALWFNPYFVLSPSAANSSWRLLKKHH